jgi:hypothetical protein
MNAFGKLLFNLPGSSSIQAAGWSEVYPIQGSSYSFVDSVLSTIWSARKATLPGAVTLIGVFISDTDVKGDSYPSSISVPDSGSYLAGGVGLYEYAVRFKVFGGTLKRSSRFLRAIPVDQIAVNGAFNPSGTWATDLSTYLSAVSGNCCIATRIHGAVAPPFYLFTHITAINSVRAEPKKIGRPFFQRRGRALIV